MDNDKYLYAELYIIRVQNSSISCITFSLFSNICSLVLYCDLLVVICL